MEGRVGPVALLRVRDFVGFDDLTKPGAAARVEQSLDVHSTDDSACSLIGCFSFLALWLHHTFLDTGPRI